MATYKTMLHLATEHRCDSSGCIATLDLKFDLPDAAPTYTEEHVIAARNEQQRQRAFKAAGWKEYPVPFTINPHHYCPAHDAPEWIKRGAY